MPVEELDIDTELLATTDRCYQSAMAVTAAEAQIAPSPVLQERFAVGSSAELDQARAGANIERKNLTIKIICRDILVGDPEMNIVGCDQSVSAGLELVFFSGSGESSNR